MAIQGNFSASMILILAVCLAPAAIASLSNEAPKERLLSYSSYPFYRMPFMPFRNGLIPRQTNSPIDPLIVQNDLGPFFGYFPNLLAEPCPDCAVCENCTVVPPTPIPASLTPTSCTADPILSAAPNGTISLNVPANTGNFAPLVSCSFGLIAYFPNTKINVKCSTLGTGVSMTVKPLVTPVSPAEAATEYISKENFLVLQLQNYNDGSKPVAAECSWKTVPA